MLRQDAEGYARTCEALADARSADLASIRCSTMLITGDEDGVSPPPAVKALSSRIKGSRVVVVPGCGHWTPIEKPAQVNGLILNLYYSFS